MATRHRLSRQEALLIALLSIPLTVPLRADQTVQVGPGMTFSPASVTVAPGEAVTWVFQGFHTSTSDSATGPEVWDSGFLSTGNFSHTFTTPGSYPYYCQVHSTPGGTAMNGVVVVSGVGITVTPTVPPATATPSPTPPPSPTLAPGGPVATPLPPSSSIPTLDPAGTILFALLLAGAAALQIATRR
jgi:plastocyanin